MKKKKKGTREKRVPPSSVSPLYINKVENSHHGNLFFYRLMTFLVVTRPSAVR